MLNPLQKIKDSIGRKQLDEEMLVELHHIFMRRYQCWIPLNEYMNMPIPTFFNLLRLINRDAEEENKMNKRFKHR